jgi:hypothetical protein
MKEKTLSKRAAAYMKRIEACTDRNEIEGIRIEFSQDCSAYRLSWSEFTILLNAQQAKRTQIRGGR